MLARGSNQASKGEQQTERNEEPGVPPGRTGPAVASDRQAVRVYDVDAPYPQFAWQIANDGSGWSSSRIPIGGSWGTMQLAAANINGEVVAPGNSQPARKSMGPAVWRTSTFTTGREPPAAHGRTR